MWSSSREIEGSEGEDDAIDVGSKLVELASTVRRLSIGRVTILLRSESCNHPCSASSSTT
jgi:hypothetical protein